MSGTLFHNENLVCNLQIERDPRAEWKHVHVSAFIFYLLNQMRKPGHNGCYNIPSVALVSVFFVLVVVFCLFVVSLW